MNGLNSNNALKALKDIASGIRRAPLWLAMGSQDIRQRYRRSRIGPFWITLSMGIMVGSLGVLYGTLFGQQLDDYLPYLAAGFVIWGLVSGLVNQGALAFIESEGLILQLAAPLSIYVFRVVWQNLLTFLHNLVVYIFVLLIFSINPGWTALLAVPAILILLVIGVAAGLLFGLIGARYRDVPQILASIVQVMFFVTPILWKVDMLPERAIAVHANPFYHLVEIIRAPLLGQVPSVESWLIVLGSTVALWIVALGAYIVFRWRIPYWV